MDNRSNPPESTALPGAYTEFTTTPQWWTSIHTAPGGSELFGLPAPAMPAWWASIHTSKG
jgi:hypothetical protein